VNGFQIIDKSMSFCHHVHVSIPIAAATLLISGLMVNASGKQVFHV
jgi:hypothetical protein